MKQAVSYARVSSKDQEREGFSIPAQQKALREYARANKLTALRETSRSISSKRAPSSRRNLAHPTSSCTASRC